MCTQVGAVADVWVARVLNRNHASHATSRILGITLRVLGIIFSARYEMDMAVKDGLSGILA